MNRNEIIEFANSIPFPRLGIENYKIIDNYFSFEFRPITLLTGQNSSGKSSLIELIKIISNNQKKIATNTKLLDCLHLDDLAIKFGSFSNAISKSNNSNEISISFESKSANLNDELRISCSYRLNNLNKQKLDISYFRIEENDITIFEINNGHDNKVDGYINFPLLWEKFKRTYIEFESLKEDQLKLSYSNNFFLKNSKNEKYEICDFDEFPVFYFYNFVDLDTFKKVYDKNDSDLIELERDIFNNFYFNSFNNEYIESDSLVSTILNEIGLNPFDLLVNNSMYNSNPIENNNALLNCITPDFDIYNYDKQLVYNKIYLKLNGISDKDINKIFCRKNFFNFDNVLIKTNISKQTKNKLETIFRKDKLKTLFLDFIKNEVEHPLRNVTPKESVFIPVVKSQQNIVLINLGAATQYETFLHGAAVEYLELDISQQNKIQSHIQYLACELFKLGDNIEINSDDKLLNIIVIKGIDRFNIAEEGYGISQIFSIILGVCVKKVKYFTNNEIITHNRYHREFNIFDSKEPMIVCIEEPESGLHPNYQSLLADMFTYLSKMLFVQFIIETHSEYLFRRLRYLTHLWYKDIDQGTKIGIPKEYWNAYYFNKVENVTIENPKIFEIYVHNNDGEVNRPFGEGFLDIATQNHLDYLSLFNIDNKTKNN